LYKAQQEGGAQNAGADQANAGQAQQGGSDHVEDAQFEEVK